MKKIILSTVILGTICFGNTVETAEKIFKTNNCEEIINFLNNLEEGETGSNLKIYAYRNTKCFENIDSKISEEIYKKKINKLPIKKYSYEDLENYYKEKEFGKVKEIATILSESGDKNASFLLGNLYEKKCQNLINNNSYYISGISNEEINESEYKSLTWYIKSYKQGKKEALSKIIINKHFFPKSKDLLQIENLYEEIYNNGTNEDMNNLGFLFFRNAGKDNKKIEKAITLFKKSIEKGNVSALNNLAFLYLKIEQGNNISKVLNYLNLAREKENKTAFENITILNKENILQRLKIINYSYAYTINNDNYEIQIK